MSRKDIGMRTTLRFALAAVAAGALAAPAAAQASGYSTAVLKESPLAYYRLDEAAGAATAHDAVGSADATLAGVQLGQAAPFADAGTSARLSGAESSASATLTRAAGSAELWVKPYGNGRNQTILEHGDPAGTGWSVSISQKKKVTFTSGGKATGSKITLPSSAWTLLTVTWGPDKVRFYANAVLRNALTPNGTLPTAASGTLHIGGGFNGWVDEVALYSRPLTGSEITSHFAATQLPANTVLPVVSGTTVSGQTLTVTPGQWTGATGGLTYQWQRCDSAGDNCDDVAGATGTTYALSAADVGSMIQVQETATGTYGSVAETSDPVGPVTAPADPNAGGTTTDPGTGTGGTTPTDPNAGAGTTTDPGTGTGGTTPTDPGTGAGGTTPTDPGTGAGGTTTTDPGTGTGGTTPTDPNAGGGTAPTDPNAGTGATTPTDPGTAAGGTTPTDPNAGTPQAPAAQAPGAQAPASTAPAAGATAPAGSTPAGGSAAPVAAAPAVCPRTTAATARKRMRMRGAGRIALVVRRSGRTVSVRVRAKRGTVRKVVYRLDGRRLGRSHRAPFARTAKRTLRHGVHVVRATVTPRHGHARTLRLRLRVPAGCGA
jgi:hypothetical protein